MALFTAAHWQFSYEVEGDGFPLILMPGMPGSTSAWTPYVSLLGELCRAITYEVGDAAPRFTGISVVFPAAQQIRHLETFLATLTIERCYLASPASSWLVALEFAIQHPKQVEGLLLVALATDTPESFPILSPTWTATLSALHVPTLLLAHASAQALPELLETLAGTIPFCTRTVLPAQAARQVGHTMMRFLMHRERQRHLVRGASFLL